MPEGRTRDIGRAEVRAYLRKARDFIATAEEAFQAERFDPAASTAIHAGINAADAITGGRLGVRSAAADHMSAADLLQGRARRGWKQHVIFDG